MSTRLAAEQGRARQAHDRLAEATTGHAAEIELTGRQIQQRIAAAQTERDTAVQAAETARDTALTARQVDVIPPQGTRLFGSDAYQETQDNVGVQAVRPRRPDQGNGLPGCERL
jgi:hypothetical protein